MKLRINITCSREGKWKFKISPTLKTNPSAGINCPARIYVHILKDVGLWIISKVVLNHSHPCCPDRIEMLKQHSELSMFVHRTIENNEEARIRPSKTYQSFVAVMGGHHGLSFIENDVRNYITRKVHNVSKQDDANEFRKYLLKIKEKNQNFFSLILKFITLSKMHFRLIHSNGDLNIGFIALEEMTKRDSYRLMCIDAKGLLRPVGQQQFTGGIPHKLNGYKRHREIEQEISHVVYNSFIKNAFDRNWNDFHMKYDVGGNKWLSVHFVSDFGSFAELFEDRHLWILVYHHVWTRMRSTQRSESMHFF
ncbi:hypothetical protein Ahy_B08g091423 [Arachis hypogaea]|uniref:Uncharacterized protein n=1 Tax=Arachis hypogaea TaxID=3818 RepID=A0A444Y281_ARAHY|nr:hypothetical protein Ahy_B08g091423 [Arachis hypogaea]